MFIFTYEIVSHQPPEVLRDRIVILLLQLLLLDLQPLLDHLHMYTLQRSGFPDLEVRDTHQEYEEIFDTYNDHVMQEDEFYFYVKFQIIVLLRDQPLVHSRPSSKMLIRDKQCKSGTPIFEKKERNRNKVQIRPPWTKTALT